MYLVDGLRVLLGSNEKAGAGVKDGLASIGASHLGVDADSDSVWREKANFHYLKLHHRAVSYG